MTTWPSFNTHDHGQWSSPVIVWLLSASDEFCLEQSCKQFRLYRLPSILLHWSFINKLHFHRSVLFRTILSNYEPGWQSPCSPSQSKRLWATRGAFWTGQSQTSRSEASALPTHRFRVSSTNNRQNKQIVKPTWGIDEPVCLAITFLSCCTCFSKETTLSSSSDLN